MRLLKNYGTYGKILMIILIKHRSYTHPMLCFYSNVSFTVKNMTKPLFYMIEIKGH